MQEALVEVRLFGKLSSVLESLSLPVILMTQLLLIVLGDTQPLSN
jgi:hypothetical protein